MNDLVFLKGKQPMTTSLIIAEGTGNEHKSVIRLINEHKKYFERWGKIYFSDLKSPNKNDDLRGRPTKVAYLNEPQATFLITLLRNTEIVLEFKNELVDRFYKMREILLNQQNAQWQELRAATKTGYKTLSDAVHMIYQLAVAAGSKTPEKRFYQNFAGLINRTLGIDPKSRDVLELWQLFEVEKLQFIAQTIIEGLVAQKGVDYHQPYKACKTAFESYARLSYINERLLVACHELQQS